MRLVPLAIVLVLPLLAISEGTHAQSVRVTATFAAGWNLVGGSPGTDLSGAAAPLYTLQARETAYQAIQPGPVVSRLDSVGSARPQQGLGYWAYFNHPAVIDVPPAPLLVASNTGGAPLYFLVNLPAGQWVMIGNPYAVAVTIKGADEVDSYDAVAGRYQTTTVLQPGQGAFAYSAAGFGASICPVGETCR